MSIKMPVMRLQNYRFYSFVIQVVHSTFCLRPMNTCAIKPKQIGIKVNRNVHRDIYTTIHGQIYNTPCFVHPMQPFHSHARIQVYDEANSCLIFAIASAGFRPFRQVRVQFKIVWQRYTLMLLFSASRRSAFFSSRESANHR